MMMRTTSNCRGHSLVVVAVSVLAVLLSSANAFTALSTTRTTRCSASTIVTSSQLHATLEAILFDCDGVLADTERDGHRVSFNQAFRENDIEDVWEVDGYGKLLEVGGGKERMTAHWNEVGWPNVIPKDKQQEKVKELHLRKPDIFMDLIDAGKIPLRPGVLRIVDDAIHAGVQLAVCSSSNEKAVSNIVERLMGPERASKFQIFAGDMVKAKKTGTRRLQHGGEQHGFG